MWRRLRSALPYVFALLVLGYCAALLLAVHTSHTIGVDCLLSQQDAQGKPGAIVGWVESESVGGPAPRPGDRLARVAGQPVDDAVDVKLAISRAGDSQRAADANVGMPAQLEDAAADENVVDQDGNRWVRVDYVSLRSSQRAIERSVWMRLVPPEASIQLLTLAWLLAQLVVLGTALVVLRRRGDFSAMLFLALCGANMMAFLGQFHWMNLINAPALIYPLAAAAILLAPLTLHFFALVPRPLPVLRRSPVATLTAIYTAPVVLLAMILICLVQIGRLVGGAAAPGAMSTALEWLSQLVYLDLFVSAAMFVAGLGVVIYGYLKARTTAERSQAVWLLRAAIFASVLLLYLLYAALVDPAEFSYGWETRAIAYATSLVFTIAYGVSVTRYKLAPINRFFNRGLLYVGITLAATAVFCMTAGVATLLVGTQYFQWENVASSAVATLLVVVLLGWIRDRSYKAAGRRFLEEKNQLDTAMRRLGQAVDQLVEPRILARQLLDATMAAVGAARGAVYLRGEGQAELDLACQTAWPQAPASLDADGDLDRAGAERASAMAVPFSWRREGGGEMAEPLESDGERIGMIVLGGRRDGGAFRPDERYALAAMARIAALALRSAQGHRTIDALKDELKANVRKIAEQQRRIVFLQSELLHQSRTLSTPATVAAAAPHSAAEPEPLRHDIRGSSPAVKRLLAQAGKVAVSDSSVLVRGESGVGKELLARAIHDNSPRRAGPFVQVHCAALSQSLLESELFGHVKGAFTGADRDRIGRFELAHTGTLFLDEIGDVNLETQTKLLRVLQERSFERVGGVKTIHVDVRVIAATHRDLEAMIRQGRFREDLFYRLNVISLSAPPLRERPGDVFELAVHFLRVYAARSGKPLERIDDDALEALAACPWPGNIRQLENAIERAVVMAEGDSIRLGDLPPEVSASPVAPRRARHDSNAAEDRAGERNGRPRTFGADRAADFEPVVAGTALATELDGLERQRLSEALAQCGGNKAQAARLLAMPRSTLFSKLRKHGLMP